MLKKKVLCVLIVLLISVLFVALPSFAKGGQEREDLSDVGEGNLRSVTPAPGLVQISQQELSPVLFDNGPLVNSTGTGVGGADESILQNNSLSMTLLGFGHQVVNNNWVADDFNATGEMSIDSITFYAYQTGSSTTSTITAYNVRIYDAQPDTPGASVIASSATIISSTWSNIYRVTESATGQSVDRPVMATVVDMGGVQLRAGTYWLAWQADGSLPSGPWAPPVTITGQTTTGNGLQSTDGDAANWENAVDSGTATQQGFPFVIRGTEAAQPIPTLSEYGLIIFSILLAGFAFTALRRRQFTGK